MVLASSQEPRNHPHKLSWAWANHSFPLACLTSSSHLTQGTNQCSMASAPLDRRQDARFS